MTDNWIEIGQLEDIPRQGARRVEIGDMKLAVFRTAEDQVFALEDRCPHKAGPLSQGIIHDGCVTCPLHNWVISLSDGTAQGADKGQVATFDLRMDSGHILLNMSALL
ncbi:MAG: nitrite reductase small subunit NirD [Pseudomonadota bacterium]